MDRRGFLAAGAALTLGACATAPRGAMESTQVPAPQWRAGDSWTFRRLDGYNSLPRGVLTREVIEAQGPTTRFRTVDERGILHDEAVFVGPGTEVSGVLSEDGPVAGRFDPPLEKYSFPLFSGKAWRQKITRSYGSGFHSYMTVSSRVEGWEDTQDAAGKSYRAIVVRRLFNLGPKDSFDYRPLMREETEWYVPELRGPAALRTYEWFAPVSPLGGIEPGDKFVYTLQSFRLA